MARLEGKVAIITGAASGQGAAEARLFVAEGARVVIADIQEAGAQLAADLGDAALFVKHDVADQDSWERVVSQVLGRFGRVDILVNNAAMFKPKPLIETEPSELDAHYRVNHLGVFLGMRAVIEPMKSAGGGSIVNIASVSGLRAIPGSVRICVDKVGRSRHDGQRRGRAGEPWHTGQHGLSGPDRYADARGQLPGDQCVLREDGAAWTHGETGGSG